MNIRTLNEYVRLEAVEKKQNDGPLVLFDNANETIISGVSVDNNVLINKGETAYFKKADSLIINDFLYVKTSDIICVEGVSNG